jgi:hypothetical protein
MMTGRDAVAKIIRVALAALATVIAIAGSAFAQSAGSIAGTVKDGSGGALPGATVTLESPAIGVRQTMTSDGRGAFVALQLPPGTYTLIVEMSGFKKAVNDGVILPTASRVSVGDLVLELGALSETVSVEENVGRLQIQSESAERSDLVTNKQLRDLALNGRNISDLFKTIPGVVAGSTITSSTVQNVVGSFNINGTRSNQHEYTVDGVTNLNLGNNAGALVSINPDALQDVKILTSNYQAEYGRAGGGYIALTTRSGTNEYRGGLRYFRRNEDYNANNYFNSANGRPKPPYRFNYYGWDFGGRLPFLGTKQDPKVFFFLAQEYYDQQTPAATPTNVLVPTAAERNGDFSRTTDASGRPLTIIDPLTRQPFPGNVMPTNRFFPGAQGLLGMFPMPNAPEGGALYNFTSQLPRDIPRREDIARVDWQIATRTRLSVRYVHNKDEDRQPLGTTTAQFNVPLAGVVRKNGPGETFSLTLTHTVGPSLINEFIYGAGRGGVFIGPINLDDVTRSKLNVGTPLLFPGADPTDTVPSVRFLGIPGQNCTATSAIQTACSVAGTDFNGTPFDQRFVINNFMNNLTKVAGRHTFKGGLYYQRANNRRTSFGPVQSNLIFANNSAHPQNTGHPFANALLGIFDSYTQAEQKIESNWFYQSIEGYLQDTWKLTPRLTLDYGLRVSHYQPIHDQEDRLSVFNPELYSSSRAVRLYRPVCVGSPCAVRAIDPAVTAAPTMANTRPSSYLNTIVPGSGDLLNGMGRVSEGYAEGGFETPSLLWGPRLGFAWDTTGRGKMVVRGGFGINYDRVDTDRIADAITNPPGISQATLSLGSLDSLASASRSDIVPVQSNVVGYSGDQKVPTVYSYSIGVQRDLGAGIVVDVAYVGTQSRNNPRQTDLNAVPYGAMFTRDGQDPTRYGGTVPAVEPNLPPAHRDAGLSFSGVNGLNPDLLRPFQGYGSMRFRSFDSKASYNSLQVALQRRFSGSLTFGLSYTLSRAKTDSAGTTDATHPFDKNAYDYALASFDRTHYFVANYVWNVPKGGRLLGGGRLARALLDNWTLSGIAWIATGNPIELAVNIAGVNATQRLLGTDAGGNAGGLQPRLRVSGDPDAGSGQGRIDPAAFSVPGINDRGPYDRFYLRNPGFTNFDLSVFKNFPIGGSGKRYLQLRVEAFNIFNSAQFDQLNTATNVTNAAGQTGAALFNNYTGLTVTSNLRPAGDTRVLGTFFGEPNRTRDPRIVQLGVKLYF